MSTKMIRSATGSSSGSVATPTPSVDADGFTLVVKKKSGRKPARKSSDKRDSKHSKKSLRRCRSGMKCWKDACPYKHPKDFVPPCRKEIVSGNCRGALAYRDTGRVVGCAFRHRLVTEHETPCPRHSEEEPCSGWSDEDSSLPCHWSHGPDFKRLCRKEMEGGVGACLGVVEKKSRFGVVLRTSKCSHRHSEPTEAEMDCPDGLDCIGVWKDDRDFWRKCHCVHPEGYVAPTVECRKSLDGAHCGGSVKCSVLHHPEGHLLWFERPCDGRCGGKLRDGKTDCPRPHIEGMKIRDEPMVLSLESLLKAPKKPRGKKKRAKKKMSLGGVDIFGLDDSETRATMA